MLGILATTSRRLGVRAMHHLPRGRSARSRLRREWRLEPLEGRALLSTFLVKSLADAGDDTLRWAIDRANASPGADTIDMTQVTGIIALKSALAGLSDTSGATDIKGPGADVLTVSRDSGPGTPEFQIFTIDAGATVRITGVTIAGGRAVEGGGVSNAGTLVIDACAVSGNSARWGGGIYSTGDLTLAAAIVRGNLVRGADGAGDGAAGEDARGGGIYSTGRLLALTDHTQVVDNQARGGAGATGAGTGEYPEWGSAGGAGGDALGGGVYAIGDTLSLTTGTIISSNSAIGGSGGTGGMQFDEWDMSVHGLPGGSGGSGRGGGLYADNRTLTFTDVTFSANSASGAAGGTGGEGYSYSYYNRHGPGGGGGSGRGGGLYADNGTLTATDVTFNGNAASGGRGGPGDDWGDSGGGGGAGQGGSLFANNGALILTHVTITGSSANGGFGQDGGTGQGGGVYAGDGTLSLTAGTLISSNSARAGSGGGRSDEGHGNVYGGSGGSSQGGGVYAVGGSLTLTAGTRISHNSASGGNGVGGWVSRGGGGGPAQGGGLYASDGTVNIDRSFLDGNTARGGDGGDLDADGWSGGQGGGGQGGGLYAVNGTLNLANTSLVDNSASGGAGGMAQGFDAQYGGPGGSGQGGGLFEDTADITNCLLASNSANGGDGGVGYYYGGPGGSGQGGGIYAGTGAVHLTSTSLASNSATEGSDGSAPRDVNGTSGAGEGGGLFNPDRGQVTLTHATLSGNSADDGGGLLNRGSLSLVNTLVAGNSAAAPDVRGTLASQGHNLIGIGDGGDGYAPTDLVGTAISPIDPRLGPLQDNGGPTPTLALLPGSPALDAGIAVAGVTTDQRGLSRSIAGAPDIGAFEFAPLTTGPLVVNGGAAQRSNVISIALPFNQWTDLPALIADGSIAAAVQVVGPGGPVPLEAADYSYDPASFTLTIDLRVTGTERTMLDDGRYELRLDPAQVFALGNPTNPPGTGSTTAPFHRLEGDFDGNAVVDAADRGLFLQHFGTREGQALYDYAFDLNGDGTISILDYARWLKKRGKSV